jgi:hypothetical protein
MKHQYFGDVNDYRKYGLLRGIQRHTNLRLGVCWMLTPDDERSDGNFTTYLHQPTRWRAYDPDLFDALAACVPLGRSIMHVQDRILLPGATFADAIVPDHRSERETYFGTVLHELEGADLIFLDPDNGIEVPSRPIGWKGSSKYTLWSEIAAIYQRGQSILVYQHFRREERSRLVAQMVADIRRRTNASSVSCFLTSNVAFFLIRRANHEERLDAATDRIASDWQDQIRCWSDTW